VCDAPTGSVGFVPSAKPASQARLGHSGCSWRALRQKRRARPTSAIGASARLAVIPIWQFAKYVPALQNARPKDSFLQFLPPIANASGMQKASPFFVAKFSGRVSQGLEH